MGLFLFFPRDTGQDLHFHLEWHQFPSRAMCFWAGGQLLKSDGSFTQQLLSPQEKVQALQTWEGLSAACPTPHLHQQQTEGSSQIQNRAVGTSRLCCLMLLKKEAVSPAPSCKFFLFGSWGCQLLGFAHFLLRYLAIGVD